MWTVVSECPHGTDTQKLEVHGQLGRARGTCKEIEAKWICGFDMNHIFKIRRSGPRLCISIVQMDVSGGRFQMHKDDCEYEAVWKPQGGKCCHMDNAVWKG